MQDAEQAASLGIAEQLVALGVGKESRVVLRRQLVHPDFVRFAELQLKQIACAGGCQRRLAAQEQAAENGHFAGRAARHLCNRHGGVLASLWRLSSCGSSSPPSYSRPFRVAIASRPILLSCRE